MPVDQRRPPTPEACPGPEQCAPVQSSPHGWHLKREIQLGHLLTTLAMASSVAVYVVKMDQRLLIVETQLSTLASAQKERDERQDKAVTDALSLLRDQLGRMDEKLDRLIESRRR